MHAIVVNLKSHFSGFSFFFFFYLLLFIFFFFSRFVSFLFRVKIQGQNRKEEVKIACYPTVSFFFFFFDNKGIKFGAKKANGKRQICLDSCH